MIDSNVGGEGELLSALDCLDEVDDTVTFVQCFWSFLLDLACQVSSSSEAARCDRLGVI